MPELQKGKATICIVNYKTLDFTRLCLRSIRKFTTYPYEIIVVDNDPIGGYAHSYALDLAFENCSTEYFVSMHSDTFINKQGWLTKLVSHIDNDPTGKCRYYNRTICCLYRTANIKKEKVNFTVGREVGLTAGKKLHFDLADKGYNFIKLHPKKLGEYVIHLAHATQAINSSEFSLRKKTVNKCSRLIEKAMSDGVIKNILEDDSLDK